MEKNDLISRKAAMAEIEEYIEEYSELEPETGYHNLKWCAMEEAKDVLSMLPSVDAIPVEWLKGKLNNTIDKSILHDQEYVNIARSIWNVLQLWQKEQEAR